MTISNGRVVNVDDYVVYRPGFGTQEPVKTRIVSMEVTELPREKYGADVRSVYGKMVNDNRVLFTLSNGHWAYSEQIQEVIPAVEHELEVAENAKKELKEKLSDCLANCLSQDGEAYMIAEIDKQFGVVIDTIKGLR